MAAGLPPPPTRADNGDFAWVAWYNSLYELLSTQGSISWGLLDKSGSSIQDMQHKEHALLTSVLGTGQYHVSSAEASKLTALNTTGHNALTSIQGNGNYHVSQTQAANLASGVSGTFTAGTKTITVTNGIITGIV